MNRLKFSLTSDQLELLLAFETASGLGDLAEKMAKDPSVVSRNLQKMAEEYPVITKVKGRWQITPLGAQVNKETYGYLKVLQSLLGQEKENRKKQTLFDKNSALIVINAQKGLLDATQEGRNNFRAELNINRLLECWRARHWPVIHIKHVSENPSSIFFKGSEGADFLPGTAPSKGENVVEKTSSSAFYKTDLESAVAMYSNIILVGFTANECIDATARDAAAKGLSAYVIGDATATFDLRDSSGKLVKADRIHKLSLMNINAFFAKVLNTDDVLA